MKTVGYFNMTYLLPIMHKYSTHELPMLEDSQSCNLWPQALVEVMSEILRKTFCSRQFNYWFFKVFVSEDYAIVTLSVR